MNFKSIASLGLVAIALAVTTITPAEANNNDKYLNQLAMQYYFQNQALANNSMLYNPALAAGYANPYAYGGTTPWAAGAMPYGTTAANYSYGGYGGCTPVVNNVSYVNPVVPQYATAAYGNVVTPRYGSGLGSVIGSRFGSGAFNNAAFNHGGYNRAIAANNSLVAHNAAVGTSAGLRHYFR